ncbi:TonB-dependent siderophore receptor [Pseudomonas sp. LS-2]|jgi:outer membrane receptor for ferric coprogen and ferric-rhodotorulic acid|nr:TonB-dependent siderophore receptor [Pseudomonas sp. LS-2]
MTIPALHRLNPYAKALVMTHSMSRRFSRTALSLAIAMPAVAYAQDQAVDFNIPAQPLASALQTFGQQSDVQVLYSPEDIQGVRSTAVSGRLSPRDGLIKLLQNTGASYGFDGKSATVSRTSDPGAMELSPTNINDIYGLGENTENTRSYTTGAATIGKAPRPLKEIPQTISVLTAQRIKDQNITTLNDVYNNVPGVITYGALNGDNQPYARGFEIDNFQINGIPIPAGTNTGITSLNWSDLVAYERVEVLKGSAGLFQGAGSPGGAINLVRKRASSDFKVSTVTQAGSWDNYRQEFDVQGALNEDKTIRGRLATSYNTRHYFYDGGKSERASTFGLVEFDVTPDTLVSAGFTYLNANNRSTMDWGLPSYSDGSKIDFKRSTNLSSPSDYNDVESTQYFVDVKHQLNDDWKITLASNYTRFNLDALYSNTGGLISPIDNSGGYNWAEGRGENNYQYNNDLFLNGNFDMFGRRSEVVLGANVSHSKRVAGRYDVTANNVDFIPDILTFDPPEYGRTDKYRTTTSTLDQEGVYGSMRVNVFDPLDVIVGARVSWWDYHQDQKNESTGVHTKTTQETNAKVLPFYGLVYALNPDWSAYASYAEIFTPQLNYESASGSTLTPRSGETYELGLKGELLDGTLNTNFAIYRTNYSGRAQTDQSQPPSCRCYVAGGKVRAEGFEAEVTGKVATGLELTAGYTYNRSKYIKNPDNTDLEGTSFLTTMPEHMLRLWANYQLPGELSKWQVGAGSNIQSGTYGRYVGTAPSTGVKNENGGFAIYNARVGYDVTKNVNLSVNVENIFDRFYYSQIGTVENNTYYGNPRNVMFTMRTNF